MFPAYLILALLLLATPLTVIYGGLFVVGLITLVAALLLILVGLRIRRAEIDFLAPIIWPIAIAAVVPALWMLFQILPLKVIGLANPIWDSAATALGRSIGGSLSIDTGATIIALVRYLSMVAVSLAAAAVATDRHRAESLLVVLTASATIIALMHLTVVLDRREAAIVCAVLGVILAATGVARAMERRRMHGENRRDSTAWARLSFAGYFVALVICAFAIPVAGSQTLFALACGVATFIVAIVVRKFYMGPWGYSAIVAVALVVAIAVITFQPATRTLGLTLAFASQAPRSLITLTHRVLSEAGWGGTGAGTFAAVLPIYQDLDEVTSGTTAPNALSAIAIEMGWPFLLVISVAVAALIVTLLHGAARRGRDSFYSTAGASCIVAVALLSFGNAAVLTTPATTILAAAVGVALAQSKSRSI